MASILHATGSSNLCSIRVNGNQLRTVRLVEIKFTILVLANCWKVPLITKSTKTCMIFYFFDM